MCPLLCRYSRHLAAKLFLLIGAPILAVEANEDGSIRNRHFRFQDEHVERLSSLVNVGDDFFGRKLLDSIGFQELPDVRTIFGNSRRVIVGHKGQFGVHEDDGAYLDGMIDRVEDRTDDFKLRRASVDGFDSRRNLQRVGRVDDEDPVAVPQQRHRIEQSIVPVGSGCVSRQRNGEQKHGQPGFHKRPRLQSKMLYRIRSGDAMVELTRTLKVNQRYCGIFFASVVSEWVVLASFACSACKSFTPWPNGRLSGTRRKSLKTSSDTMLKLLNSRSFPVMFRRISVISQSPSPTSACCTTKRPPLSSRPTSPHPKVTSRNNVPSILARRRLAVSINRYPSIPVSACSTREGGE